MKAQRRKSLGSRQPDTGRSKSDLGWHIAIFVAALLVRLIVSSDLAQLPLARTPKLDSAEYLEWGRQIAGGSFAWPSPLPHGPGYPLFLGALLALFGQSLDAVRIVQSVIGAASCVLTASVARRWFGRASAITAGFLQALHGPLVYVEVSLFAEGFLVFLILVALRLFIRPHTSTAMALTGFVLGVAVLVRPTAVLLLPVLLALLMWDKRHFKPWVPSLALAAACLLAVLPVLVLNWRATGSLQIQGHAGLNFYLGNTPSASGLPWARLGSGWAQIEGEASRAGIDRPADQDRYYLRKTVREIYEHPLGYVRLIFHKTLWLLQSEEVRDSHSFYFFKSQSPLLQYLPTLALTMPLGLAGILLAFARRRLPAVLAGYVGVISATCVLFVVGLRYRLPVVPALLTFAGYGAASAWEMVRAQRFADGVKFGAVLLAAFVLSELRRHEPSHNFAEEWAFTGMSLVTERNLPAAREAYQRALAAGPDNGLAWDGLGVVHYNVGELEDAKGAFEHALTLDPNASVSEYHLGLVYDRLGQSEAALRHLRRAVQLSPSDVRFVRQLSTTLAAVGAFADAAQHLEQLLRFAPGDSESRLMLARLLASQGRMQEGLVQAQLAAREAPENGDAWWLAAALATDTGRIDEAHQALVRAQSVLGAQSPEIELGWAALRRAEKQHEAADRILRSLIQRNPSYEPAVRLFLRNAAEAGTLPAAESFLHRMSPPRD